MNRISVVIPCYGSESSIEDVVARLEKTFAARQHTNYEIVLVNDCSPDGVYAVISRIAAANPKIIGISLAKNFGQHAALMAGYHYCSGDIVVSMDDDGQTPPEELFKLVDAIDTGYDVVYAKYPEVKQSLFRRFGSRVNKWMMESLLGKPKDIVANSYFACRKFVVDEMVHYEKPYPYLGGLVFRATKNIGSVDVEQKERASGQSGYTLGKLISLWANGFTAFSVKPLRLATFCGVACGAVGFVYLIVIVVRKIINPMVPMGYSSTMAVLLFLGGIILFVLGLIGEYVGRIYISISNSPQYVVRSTINVEKQGASATFPPSPPAGGGAP